MSSPLYTTEILRLAASLQEERELEREDGRAELRSPTCGSRITIAVELDEERRVRMISQRVHACAFGQASAALVQQHAIGRAHDEVSEALVTIQELNFAVESLVQHPSTPLWTQMWAWFTRGVSAGRNRPLRGL